MSNNTMNIMNMNSSEEEEEEEEELNFHCEVCLRKFKSGKALGGHKRMHNMSSTNNKKTKTSTVINHHKNNNNVSEENSSDSSDDEDGDELCCRLCGKSFPSQKSLFGHMRSHPERGWRGIDPPLEDELQQHQDPPPPPPLNLRWSMTGRRGGACPTDSSSMGVLVVPGMDHDSTEGAINLMLLTAAKTKNTMVPKQEGEEEKEEEDADEDEEEVSRSKKKKKPLTTTPKKDYNCSVCNKSFRSYQALGGHMSSHNKLPHNNDNNNSNTNNDDGNNKVAVVIDLNQLPPPDHSS